MKSIVRGGVTGGLTVAAMLMLTGCGSFDGGRSAGPAPVSTPIVGDGPAKLGAPFTIDGVTHTPADIPDYDDVGYASWYGEELAGRPTANGETFDPDAISAAHKTLPLPSYVEVTALDTGRTILVRVNDRGPMKNDRLIDLSRGAAAQLGLTDGVSAVRVRRTNPPAAEKAQLRAGKPVTERIATPDSLLLILRNRAGNLPVPVGVAKAPVAGQPAPPVASGSAKPGDDRFVVEGPDAKPPTVSTTPAPTASKPAATTGANHVVQVGAFSSEARAAAAAKSVGGTVSKAGNLWRVRMGPFANSSDAQAALRKAKAKGFRDAVVIRDR